MDRWDRNAGNRSHDPLDTDTHDTDPLSYSLDSETQAFLLRQKI